MGNKLPEPKCDLDQREENNIEKFKHLRPTFPHKCSSSFPDRCFYQKFNAPYDPILCANECFEITQNI